MVSKTMIVEDACRCWNHCTLIGRKIKNWRCWKMWKGGLDKVILKIDSELFQMFIGKLFH